MSEKEKASIQQASGLVNAALYAKGYFHESDSTNTIDQLKFSTIDDLDDPKERYANDKLVINTIYQLLQELEKSKRERESLQKQCKKKDEIINKIQNQVEEFSEENNKVLNKFKSIDNKHEVLVEKFENLSKENINLERLISFEKNLNKSIKKKFEIDMNRKNQTIKQLQDRLVSSNNRIKNIPKDGTSSEADENSIIILQSKIETLSVEQDKSLIFLNFLLNYLKLLVDNKENLPSTPIFFFDHFENQVLSMSSNDDILIKSFDKIEDLIFESLDKLYDSIISVEYGNDKNNNRKSSNNELSKFNSSRIKTLENEIEILKKNLDSALETNEKWSKRFQTLHSQDV